MIGLCSPWSPGWKAARGPVLQEELTDKELVRRYQQGELASYEEIVRRHYQRIYRLASIFLADSTFAADATQEVFVRAVKGFRGFLFRAEPATWLYRTTRYVCHEFNRKNREAVEEISEAFEVSAEEHMGNEQAAAQIRELINALPERQREVVVLRIFEDLSVQQTAELMNIRQGTVKANLHKALNSLREKFKTTENRYEDQ